MPLSGIGARWAVAARSTTTPWRSALRKSCWRSAFVWSRLARRPARFIGMIGSRRKIRLIFDDLLREGIPREDLRRVHAPLGLDIGSQTVPEIAVSIVAELIAHRNLADVPAPLNRPSILAETPVAAFPEDRAC